MFCGIYLPLRHNTIKTQHSMKKSIKMAVSAIIPGLIASLSLQSCSDDNQPDEPRPFHPVETGKDIIHNNLYHVVDFSGSGAPRIPVNSLEPVEISIPEGAEITARVVTEGNNQYVEFTATDAFTSNRAVIPVAVSPKGCPEEGRHMFITAVKVADGISDRQAPARSVSNPENPMLSSYSEYMGKGTFCFGQLGNTTASILLYDHLSELDEKYITVNSTLNQEFMAEHSEESSESSMHQVSVNLGIDFKKTRKVTAGFDMVGVSGGKGIFKPRKENRGSISGSFNLGVTSETYQSLDFEYYMNLYSVRKSEVAIQMPLFELSENNQHPDTTLMALINPKFLEQLGSTEPESFNPTLFFDTWGTDLITNGVFGGRCLYLYAREENVYEHTLGVDASAEMKVINPTSGSAAKSWLDIYQANHSPYINSSVDVGYHSEDYSSATKAWSFYSVTGGYMTDNDAGKWLEGFNGSENSENWSLVSYRRLSSSALNPDTDDDSAEFNWDLYPVEKLANNVLGIYLSRFGDQMTHADSVAYERMENVVKKLADAKMDYLESHQFMANSRSPLILADVIMKNGSNGHKSGEPKSFIAEDPRHPGKKRVYYPMMANKYAHYDKGYAVETTQNAFYNAAADDEDHYWYYALAHENDCDGITDIRFLTEGEIGDYYVKRGDCSDCGGLIITDNYVWVKFAEPGTDISQKLTAFGLYDKKDAAVEPTRIFASTGGSELKRNCLESEENAWKEWWSTQSWLSKYQWNEGSMTFDIGIWCVLSTKPLDIKRFKGDNVCQPLPW